MVFSKSFCNRIFGHSLSRERISEGQIVFSVLLAGITFVIDRYAMINGLAPVTYNAWKYIISSFFLQLCKTNSSSTPVIMKQKDSFSSDDYVDEIENERLEGDFPDFIKHSSNREIYIWGIICGLGDSGASIFQQVGLVTVSADKASFIIGMYVVFVPLVTWLFPWCGDTGGGAVSVWSWISVSLSILGLYLLSGCAEGLVCVGGAVEQGEFFVFISMLFWVASIIAGDMAAKRVDILAMTSVAFLTCALVTTAIAVVFEPLSWRPHLAPALLMTSAGRFTLTIVFSSALLEAVGFTLGTMGQEFTPPTRAALLFSLSSVICAVAGYLFIDEELTAVEIVGCLLMTAAAVLPNLFDRPEDKDTDKGGGDRDSTDSDGILTGPLHSMEISGRESPKSRLLAFDFVSDSPPRSTLLHYHRTDSNGSTNGSGSGMGMVVKKLFARLIGY